MEGLGEAAGQNDSKSLDSKKEEKKKKRYQDTNTLVTYLARQGLLENWWHKKKISCSELQKYPKEEIRIIPLLSFWRFVRRGL